MERPRKLLPITYCATDLESTLLVEGLMCYFIGTHFLKNIREKSKSFKKHTRLTHLMLLSNECEKRKYTAKIFYQIIVPKL